MVYKSDDQNHQEEQHNNQDHQELMSTDLIELTGGVEAHTKSVFQEVMKDIQHYNQKADQLLRDYRADPDRFIDQTDEEDIIALVKSSDGVKQFTKDITDTLKNIKRFFNDERDRVVNGIVEQLNDAGYQDLLDSESDLKQLNKDMLAARKERRWDEIHTVFDKLVKHYADVQQLAPVLFDFQHYKQAHPKLVTGSKNKPIGDKEFKRVDKDLQSYATGVKLIRQNQWGLSPESLLTLSNGYSQDGSIDYIMTTAENLKQREIKRQEALEQEAKEREAKQKEAERLAKVQAEAEEKAQAQLAEAQKAQSKLSQEEARQQAQALQAQAQEAKRQQEVEKREQEAMINRYIHPRMRQAYPKIVDSLLEDPSTNDLVTARAKASATVKVTLGVCQGESIFTDEIDSPESFNQLIVFIQEMGRVDYQD